MAKKTVYEIVSDKIIEQMKQGVVPWHKPWGGASETAVSYTTQRPYSFLNQMLLGRAGEYLTYNQIVENGGTLKPGARPGLVTFYKKFFRTVQVENEQEESDEEEPETHEELRRTGYMLRYYNVYHIDDTEGIESKTEKTERPVLNPISEAEKVISDYVGREKGLVFAPVFGDRAYYSPSEDKVVVPLLSQYDAAEEYYSTAFHELTHSTLPKRRCNRREEGVLAYFGSKEYSREELVAEIGASMLLHKVRISTEKAFRNSVAYLQSWISVLKNDPKMIVYASAKAEQAAKYILNEINND